MMRIQATCPVYTLEQIKEKEIDFGLWKMRNDMIKKVEINSCELGILSLGIDYVSEKQGVGYGHRSEGNIGLMILNFAKLLGLGSYNGDILEAMKGKPIRVLFKEDWGGHVVDCTYIGHFMEDKFIKMSELIMIGLNTKR